MPVVIVCVDDYLRVEEVIAVSVVVVVVAVVVAVIVGIGACIEIEEDGNETTGLKIPDGHVIRTRSGFFRTFVSRQPTLPCTTTSDHKESNKMPSYLARSLRPLSGSCGTEGRGKKCCANLSIKT